MTLDDMLLELDMVDFPSVRMRQRAESKGIRTAGELRQFIQSETLINEVGDKLAPELRKLGAAPRRETAIKMLQSAGKLPKDYV